MKAKKLSIATVICALFLFMACTLMQTGAQAQVAGTDDGVQVCFAPENPYNS